MTKLREVVIRLRLIQRRQMTPHPAALRPPTGNVASNPLNHDLNLIPLQARHLRGPLQRPPVIVARLNTAMELHRNVEITIARRRRVHLPRS